MLIREDPLFSLIPLLATLNLGAFVLLLFLCRHFIIAFLREIDRTTYFFLCGIFLAALLIRLFVPPIQHIMYIDEAWYMEAAKNFVQHGHPGEYPKPIGWPLVLSFFFRVFGISNWVALYTMIGIGALTAVSVFFLTFAILRDRRAALLAAVMIALCPVHIRWSATAETNVIALFMACIALSFSFLYYHDKRDSLLWLSMAAIAFAAQFRLENYLLFPMFLFGAVLFTWPEIKRGVWWFLLPVVVFSLLAAPSFVQVLKFYFIVDFSDGQSGVAGQWQILGWHSLIDNAGIFWREILFGKLHPMLVSVFALFGIILMMVRRRKEFYFLVSWVVLFGSMYFVRGFWVTGEPLQTRFLLVFYLAMFIFASWGIVWISEGMILKSHQEGLRRYVDGVVLALVIFLFFPYVTLASRMDADWQRRLETKIPELAERDIPASCTIIASWPTVLKSTTDLNVIDINVFFQDPDYQEQILKTSPCVLFFDDHMCAIAQSGIENCSKIKRSYPLEKYRLYSEGGGTFGFYRVPSGSRHIP